MFLKYAVKTATLTKDNRNLYLEKIDSLGVQKGNEKAKCLVYTDFYTGAITASCLDTGTVQLSAGSRVGVALTSMASLFTCYRNVPHSQMPQLLDRRLQWIF